MQTIPLPPSPHKTQCPPLPKVLPDRGIAKLAKVLILLQLRELGGVFNEQGLIVLNCDLTDRTNAHEYRQTDRDTK